MLTWDEREERLVLRGSQGFLAGDVGRVKYRLGEGLAGWVFLERQVVNAPDLAADPRWKRDPEHEAPLPAGQANNALVVPLIVGEKSLGVLGVVNNIGAPAFTAGDESLITALAGQTAIAIENARLYEDVRSLSGEEVGNALPPSQKSGDADEQGGAGEGKGGQQPPDGSCCRNGGDDPGGSSVGPL